MGAGGAGLRSLNPWVLSATFNGAGLKRLHKGAGVAGTNDHTLFGLKCQECVLEARHLGVREAMFP